MSTMRFGFLSACLVSVLAASSGCIFQGGDDEDEGSGGESSAAGASGPGEGGNAAGGNGSGGGAGLDGVGPSSDPSPDASAPGEYACAGCPEAVIDLADADAGTETVFVLSGKAAEQTGHGAFLVIDEASGQFLGGGLLVDADTGDFSQEVPIFCGSSLIKAYFQNASGISTYVKRVTNSGCLPEDVRVTVAWDATTRQWTSHLVRFGGTIQDSNSDCHQTNQCDGNYPDWGVAGDTKDNPVMDTYAFPSFMGVENINYPSAEDGLTVLVENAGTVDGLTPAGTLYINLHDQPTYVKQIPVLKPQEVLIAADIDGAAGTMAPIDEIYDCAAEFASAECEADLP